MPATTFDPTTLSKITQDQISSARKALSARYGLQRTALEGQEKQVRNSYAQQILALKRARQEGLEDVRFNAVDRGIYQSGIRLANEAKVTRDVAEAEARAAEAQTTTLADIQTALATLASSQAADEATQVQRIEDAALALQQQLAANGLLAEGDAPGAVTPEAIAAMLRALIGA